MTHGFRECQSRSKKPFTLSCPEYIYKITFHTIVSGLIYRHTDMVTINDINDKLFI